jgi:hypothetical protein
VEELLDMEEPTAQFNILNKNTAVAAIGGSNAFKIGS